MPNFMPYELLFLQANLLKIFGQQSHRKDCYTQGLFFLNDTHLFESCGQSNQSFFYLMQYSTDPFVLNQVYKSKVPWKADINLEGATIFKRHIYLLTWRDYVVYKLDPTNFSLLAELTWRKQGNGLTNNATHMFISDGTDKIYLVNEEFEILEQKIIRGFPGQFGWNQLEFHNGYIYANIFFDQYIYKIDYQAGEIVEQYDGKTIIQAEYNQNTPEFNEGLNGIAYNQLSKKFLATGNDWGQMFEVSLELPEFQVHPLIFSGVLLLCLIL